MTVAPPRCGPSLDIKGRQNLEGRKNANERGAQGGTRTHTVLLPKDFKSSASTIPPPGQQQNLVYRRAQNQAQTITII